MQDSTPLRSQSLEDNGENLSFKHVCELIDCFSDIYFIAWWFVLRTHSILYFLFIFSYPVRLLLASS